MSIFETMPTPEAKTEKPAEEKKVEVGQFQHEFKDGTVNIFKTREELMDAIDAENENSK